MENGDFQKSRMNANPIIDGNEQSIDEFFDNFDSHIALRFTSARDNNQHTQHRQEPQQTTQSSSTIPSSLLSSFETALIKQKETVARYIRHSDIIAVPSSSGSSRATANSDEFNDIQPPFNSANPQEVEECSAKTNFIRSRTLAYEHQHMAQHFSQPSQLQQQQPLFYTHSIEHHPQSSRLLPPQAQLHVHQHHTNINNNNYTTNNNNNIFNNEAGIPQLSNQSIRSRRIRSSSNRHSNEGTTTIQEEEDLPGMPSYNNNCDIFTSTFISTKNPIEQNNLKTMQSKRNPQLKLRSLTHSQDQSFQPQSSRSSIRCSQFSNCMQNKENNNPNESGNVNTRVIDIIQPQICLKQRIDGISCNVKRSKAEFIKRINQNFPTIGSKNLVGQQNYYDKVTQSTLTPLSGIHQNQFSEFHQGSVDEVPDIHTFIGRQKSSQAQRTIKAMQMSSLQMNQSISVTKGSKKQNKENQNGNLGQSYEIFEHNNGLRSPSIPFTRQKVVPSSKQQALTAISQLDTFKRSKKLF